MLLRDGLGLAFGVVRAEKLRAALTGLGIAVGIAAALLLAQHDKAQAARIGALAAALGVAVIVLDQYMRTWNSYVTNPRINGRPIATVGSATPT
ncbi:MAG: hypothetical protein KDC48_14025, partial [Planctomycetes bacterium]|nr:hypothetical protein [Planctomycetota bacterium]